MPVPEIHHSQDPDKTLANLPTTVAQRIRTRLQRLSHDPVPHRLATRPRRDAGDRIFRYRIGTYCALYLLKDTDHVVLITKIDKLAHISQDPAMCVDHHTHHRTGQGRVTSINRRDFT